MNALKLDRIIARMILLIIVVIGLHWIYTGLLWIVGWWRGLGPIDVNWWGSAVRFCGRNLSILIAIYVIAGLQTAGLVEFRYRRAFGRAFLLALILTPPGMLLAWGRKTTVNTKD